jgi:glycosyltransferase involved in cell wall biosynthesis
VKIVGLGSKQCRTVKRVKNFQQNSNLEGKNLLQKVTNKISRESRVSVIWCRRKRIILGDSIRAQKILESIVEAGFQVSEMRFPVMDRYYLSTYEGLKNTFLNIFPLRKSSNLSLNLSRKIIIKHLEFDISLNSLMQTFKRIKPDVVLVETSIVGWVTSIAAKKLSIPCIIDVHGLSFAEERGYEHKSWQQTMNLEKEAFENCDHLIVVSEKMSKCLSEQFKIPNEKMIVAPNGSDSQRLLAKYENPLKVVYGGVFSYWEKVDDFLDLAKQADRKTFKFYLAGTGPMKNQLTKRIREEKIPINYIGYVPRQQIHKLFAKMQIGIAPSTKDLARQVASPIKIFDYMASGLPVVTPRIGDWGNMVEKENCGVAIKPDNIENYLEALNTIAEKAIWTNMSHNAVKAIEEKYSWSISLKPIMNLLAAYCERNLRQ